MLPANNTGLHCTVFRRKLKRPFFFCFIFLFPPPLCSCWHNILQGMSWSDPGNDLQKTKPNISGRQMSQLSQCESQLSWGHQKKQHHQQLTWPPWQVAAHAMSDCYTANARQGTQAPQGQTQPQTSRWSMCLCALYWDQGDGGENIQRITESLNH